MQDFCVIIGKTAYAAAIGMSADCIVRNAHSHPDNLLLLVAAATLHFHNPCLIGIAYREGLALAVVTILLGKARHHVDCLTGCLRPLKGKVHQ